MASVTVAFYTLCFLLCGLHGGVTAKKPMHLTYYAQEYQGGPNNTVLSAAGTGQGNSTTIGWGTFLVIDNFLKAGPKESSLQLGRITGSGAVTTKGGMATGGAQIDTQHIFNDASKFAASSLTVTGTISTPSPASPWECIVPGGTGAFRGYSGYGILTPLANYTVPPLYVYQWDMYLSPKK